MKQFLIFGLGNPGEEFMHTRHNLGADVVLLWIENMRSKGATVSGWKTHEKFHARVCEVTYNDTNVSILSPLVFMNESGKTLTSYIRYHSLEREDILVIHDELEIALGETKLQLTGSAHGHNGMRSIHEYVGDTNIPQFRIGIGRPTGTTPIDTFVLSTFTPEEKSVLQEKHEEILRAISEIVFS